MPLDAQSAGKTRSRRNKQPRGRQAQSQGWRGWLAPALLVAAAAIAHAPAIGGAFIWDDEEAIQTNPLITQPDGLRQIWTSTEQMDYWPISYSTLWLEWRLWGIHASGYRLTNILLHGINAILVWQLARRLAIPGAWLCGLVFAIHPLSVESVDWIIQRKTLLATLFSLASLVLALGVRERSRTGMYWLAVTCFALAMLSKTSAVMIPAVLLVLIWWQRRCLGWEDLVWSAPWFVVALCLGSVAVWFQENRAIGQEIVRDDSLASRLAIAGDAIWFYLYKAFVPLRLNFIYPRWRIDPRWAVNYLPLVALAGLGLLFWWKRKGWGAAPLAALAFYVLNLLPVLGLADIYFMKYSLVADHWQYLALPGAMALAVGAGAYAATRYQALRAAGVGTASVACVLLLALAMNRARVFGAHDNVPLWRDTLHKNPDAWLAYNNLGRALIGRQDFAGALDCFQHSVRLAPDDFTAHLSLGLALMLTGKADLAQAQFKEVLRLRPDLPTTYNQRAKQALERGDPGQALGFCQQAVALEPTNAQFIADLGVTLCQLGRTAEGAQFLRQADAMNPKLGYPRQYLRMIGQ